ncbi:lipoate--protein ligase family protein [Virgibacillus sp. MSJ-26]|uniref:lipoate--protein ligase family protein n=1 Tax=Virgibacillus sp. MSJ-26 TaxID=2841522 RepID=UPI001C115D09|nr:lipoate--protein ligase family protein [Virgibacillus sp. MSJ-26]MBU5465226.1 lipoate--protein ligase family protein [Virgibacillus sp. MSJ-26]
MKSWKQIIQYSTFRYIDHSHIKTFESEPYTALTSFAIDDALATSVSNKKSPPTMRTWVHPKTVVLGIPDARVPFLAEGVHLLKNEGYHVIVRNSGGLAVALDEGVLNLSLILPEVKHLSIHDCYEAMVSFVQYMLKDLTDDIKAFEIVDSYCPGDYDLSINNQKFAGISQRRIKDGAAIQIYLDVEGNSKQRAQLIRRFYDKSIQGNETKFTYPKVNPDKMASLSTLLGINLTVPDLMERVLSTLKELNEDVIMSNKFSSFEKGIFGKRYEQMGKRNQVIREIN